MLLDTLKKFAFYGMDVQILKDNDTDCIVIENSRKEFHNRHDGYISMSIRIVTKINLDGEIISSKIFKTSKIRIDNIYKDFHRIIDKSSQEYYDNLPSLHSEEIQNAMDTCSCDIPNLSPGDCINIYRFGIVNVIRLCDRKIY